MTKVVVSVRTPKEIGIEFSVGQQMRWPLGWITKWTVQFTKWFPPAMDYHQHSLDLNHGEVVSMKMIHPEYEEKGDH